MFIVLNIIGETTKKYTGTDSIGANLPVQQHLVNGKNETRKVQNMQSTTHAKEKKETPTGQNDLPLLKHCFGQNDLPLTYETLLLNEGKVKYLGNIFLQYALSQAHKTCNSKRAEKYQWRS